jgi:hypothetical protein
MQGPVSWLRKGASREAAESEAAKLFSLGVSTPRASFARAALKKSRPVLSRAAKVARGHAARSLNGRIFGSRSDVGRPLLSAADD